MKQAVILAAGEGRRLRPFTVTKPKVMLSIAGKPMLRYVIESLAQQGIRNIVLVVGYRKEQIFDYIGSGEQFGVQVTYVTQDKQAGTAHALLQAKDVANTEFLVLAGDKLIEPDTIAELVRLEPPAMLVKRVDNPTRFGVVTVEKGFVKSIAEKPRLPESNVINTGIYSFTREVFSFEEELDIPDVINRMLIQGVSIAAVEAKATWLDVAYPWDILKVNDAILRRTPPSLSGMIEAGVSLKNDVSVGKDTVIKSNSYVVGPVVIGRGCEIGPGVCIFPSTSIGDNVLISPFTEVRNSTIGDDVHVGTGAIIQDSVIDRGCVIGGRFTACSGEAEIKVDGEYHSVKVGAMLGENCTLGDSVTAQPGVVVGNYGQVKAHNLISGRIPDRSLIV